MPHARGWLMGWLRGWLVLPSYGYDLRATTQDGARAVSLLQAELRTVSLTPEYTSTAECLGEMKGTDLLSVPGGFKCPWET